ncbi:MAG: hypothetical protein QGM50_02965 [Anaerolineae bacterium]|nr:hypothetical protein [Anaerolineae bacterium]MDK1080785.1 hypothetical protein [Anaerolineae bacterium]MDK1117731.1 hypothetical protein [Anaerolineae bacterium]
MYAPVNHILPLTTVERERLLPVSGTVTVKLDQRVNPTDVIGEANWSREHYLIDITRILRITPSAADRLITVSVDDRISEGEQVAVSKGIIPRTIRSEREGRVVAVGDGQILMETGDTSVKLKAGMPGIVIQVIPNKGAIIRTVGALIQGSWGNGRIDTGMLHNMTEKSSDVLDASRLDRSLRGSIILAGLLKDADTLHTAEDLPVRGLILSSISPNLLPVAQKMRFPIVAIDGIGQLPMNTVAYKLLTSNAKRETTINAEAYDRYTGTRPEVIIPLPVSEETPSPNELGTLQPGQTVRMRAAPHAGAIGTLASLRSGLTTLPSGLRASVAEVNLENGEQIIVPLVNLEIVG